MTLFVTNAGWSRYFAASEIVEISRGEKRAKGYGYIHNAKLRDGTTIVLDGHEADKLIDAIISVLPAQPGYNTIKTGNCVSGEPYTAREPVLAWQMMSSGEMRPVTIRGPNNGEINESVAVEQPSGEIWCPTDDAIYHSFAAFRDAELERQASEDAERAARNAKTGEQS